MLGLDSVLRPVFQDLMLDVAQKFAVFYVQNLFEVREWAHPVDIDYPWTIEDFRMLEITEGCSLTTISVYSLHWPAFRVHLTDKADRILTVNECSSSIW